MTSWFEKVFGFQESLYSYHEIKNGIFKCNVTDGGSIQLITQCGGSLHVGRFDSPRVCDLRAAVKVTSNTDPATFTDIAVGTIAELIQDPENSGAVFQVASQFNALEMTCPSVSPAHGITMYVNDNTQGPACAIACPAATAWRSYFLNDVHNQFDMLKDATPNGPNKKWEMKNGYLMPLVKSLGRDDIVYENIRVAVHWDAQVLPVGHKVCQVFSSAVPVSYMRHIIPDARDIEPFAQRVLDAMYDAVMAVAAIVASKSNKRTKLFLTAIGGGVFQNDPRWILSAVAKAFERYKCHPIDVYMVHRGRVAFPYKPSFD